MPGFVQGFGVNSNGFLAVLCGFSQEWSGRCVSHELMVVLWAITYKICKLLFAAEQKASRGQHAGKSRREA